MSPKIGTRESIRMKKCKICNGTRKIELFTSVVDCECRKPRSTSTTPGNNNYDVQIVPYQSPTISSFRICSGCFEARDGEPCVRCNRWVCIYCAPLGICRRCVDNSVVRNCTRCGLLTHTSFMNFNGCCDKCYAKLQGGVN